jgi:hypothetical protein
MTNILQNPFWAHGNLATYQRQKFFAWLHMNSILNTKVARSDFDGTA